MLHDKIRKTKHVSHYSVVCLARNVGVEIGIVVDNIYLVNEVKVIGEYEKKLIFFLQLCSFAIGPTGIYSFTEFLYRAKLTKQRHSIIYYNTLGRWKKNVIYDLLPISNASMYYYILSIVN